MKVYGPYDSPAAAQPKKASPIGEAIDLLGQIAESIELEIEGLEDLLMPIMVQHPETGQPDSKDAQPLHSPLYHNIKAQCARLAAASLRLTRLRGAIEL